MVSYTCHPTGLGDRGRRVASSTQPEQLGDLVRYHLKIKMQSGWTVVQGRASGFRPPCVSPWQGRGGARVPE